MTALIRCTLCRESAPHCGWYRDHPICAECTALLSETLGAAVVKEER